MTQTVIKVENLYKEYKVGEIGYGTLTQDLQSLWARIRGKEDPNSLISTHYNADAEKKSFLALKDINFEVKQGDRLGIIGKNGAGKSTLLKILSRITSPTKGEVKIKGRVSSLLEVGTGFHPELTGRENIYLNGSILGMKRKEIDKKLDEIIDFAGIEKHIDTPVKRYSSGMYVRLGFAVAAHLDPEILIVDEVLAVGDAEFQKKAIGKMEDVSTNEGRTILFVSHNMASVRRLCNKGILIKEGSIIQTGDMEEVTDFYLSEFVTDNQVRSISFEPDKSLPMSITGIEIYAKGKNKDAIFDITDTLCVRIRYSVYEDNLAGINIGFTLSTNDGVIVFYSWDVDNNQQLLKGRLKGDYETEFEIPETLNLGQYLISINCGRVNVGAIQRFVNCIAFEIENIKVDGYTKSFSRGGFIKSDIKWNFKRI